MNLKDVIEQDIKNVFINVDEFATEHVINGQTLLAVVDDDIIDERKGRTGGGMPYAEGVFNLTKMLYIKQEDLGYVPVKDERFELDDTWYFIVKVNQNFGVLEIELGANET